MITLDDLAAMMASDEHHRYELSPEGLLTVAPPAGYTHARGPVDDVLLVVEIISPGSEAMDTTARRTEYASAGIPRYWTVDQDPAQTVTVYRLDGSRYQARVAMPLAWVLDTSPVEHDLD